MSQAQVPDELIDLIGHYAPGTGSDRYVRFAEEVLDLRTPAIQRQILEALEQHRRVCVVAANGVGKSYIAAAGAICALYTNADTTVNVTSGSYGQLDDTIWKPMKNIHRRSGLPGRTLDNTRELRSGLDDEWYAKCLSPRNPGDLEGRHNDHMVYVIEEADKPGITHEHIDSAESTLTDDGDRMLVIANPPTDETNVVADLMDSDKWHTLSFPSWESHNVKNPEDKVPGLVELSEIRENWEEWNGEEWPGLDAAIQQTADRTDLDTRWYRRRAGRIPPEASETWRPFSVADVRAAFERQTGLERETPRVVGIDVARSGDNTVMAGIHNNALRIHYSAQGANFEVQEPELFDRINEWPDPHVVVDATPMGRQMTDRMDTRFPNVVPFNNGDVARDDAGFRNCWAEGLQALGEWLRDGGSFQSAKLREELLTAARCIEFTETHLASRGGSVVEASSKDRIKDRLGRSPDYLDAALMAAWQDQTEELAKQQTGQADSATFSW